MQIYSTIVNIGYKTFSMLNSAEHEIYHAHVKMPTIVGILTFISIVNTTSERLKAITSSFVCIFVFMSSWNLVLSWVEHEKSFITSGQSWFTVCHNFYNSLFLAYSPDGIL